MSICKYKLKHETFSVPVLYNTLMCITRLEIHTELLICSSAMRQPQCEEKKQKTNLQIV